MVVKTQRPHRLRPRTSLAKESRLLQHLADTVAGLIPHLFGYGRLQAPETLADDVADRLLAAGAADLLGATAA